MLTPYETGTVTPNYQATCLDRAGSTINRTPTPSLASMSIRPSVLNSGRCGLAGDRSHGAAKREAASACFSFFDAIALCQSAACGVLYGEAVHRRDAENLEKPIRETMIAFATRVREILSEANR
jgi:hypothetical protein